MSNLEFETKNLIIDQEDIPAGCYDKVVLTNPSNNIYSVAVCKCKPQDFTYTEVEFPLTRKVFCLKGEILPKIGEIFSLLTGIEIIALISKVEENAFKRGVLENQQQILQVLGVRQ